VSARDLLRLAHAGWTLARAGAFGLLELDDLPLQARIPVRLARTLEPHGLTPAERGRRLSGAVTRLGPSYINSASSGTRADIVGIELPMRSAVSRTTCRVPHRTGARIVEANIGRPWRRCS
jgi:ubiquinone biosynthesis protein